MVEYSEHTIKIQAPVDKVFELIADAASWPVIFGPTIYVEHLERSDTIERFRIWALANGEVKSWSSRRKIDRASQLITFEQEVSQPPVASMSGTWLFDATADGGTEVSLEHQFTAVDDDPESVQWINTVLDSNSASELAGLRSAAEVAEATDELVFTFADSVRVQGPLALAYEFIKDAEQWPSRLPHVQRLDLRTDDAGVQHMEMDTLAPDGNTHTTSSVRVCFDGDQIVYKQVGVPALLSGHSGRWTFRPDGDEVVVTSEHTVAIKPEAVQAVLGEGKTVRDARASARGALGGNSMITLLHAKQFAEAGSPDSASADR
ncbi:MAG: aromatase/cyclase [Jatrophihabitans sp.]